MMFLLFDIYFFFLFKIIDENNQFPNNTVIYILR